MFPRRFYGERMFAARYFPQSQGGEAEPQARPASDFRGTGGRTFRGDARDTIKGTGGRTFRGGQA